MVCTPSCACTTPKRRKARSALSRNSSSWSHRRPDPDLVGSAELVVAPGVKGASRCQYRRQEFVKVGAGAHHLMLGWTGGHVGQATAGRSAVTERATRRHVVA